MGFSSPNERLLAPLTGTLAADASDTEALGSVTAFRVKRLGTSDDGAILRWIGADGAVATGYQLTAADPDSGWILADKETELTVLAKVGSVDYEIMRQQR